MISKFFTIRKKNILFISLLQLYHYLMGNVKRTITSKDIITLALYELVLRSNDYNAITVNDICEKAGVSRMTFYRHYNNKDDVFIAYSDERFAEFFVSIKNVKNIDAKFFLTSLFNFCKRYKRQIYILSKSHQENLILSQFENYISYLLAKEKRYERAKKNPFIVPSIAGALFNILIFWLNEKEETPPEEAVSYCLEIMKLMRYL